MKVVFTPVAATGHVNPTIPLMLALQERGHDVVAVVPEDVVARFSAVGIATRVFRRKDFPFGSLQAQFAELGVLTGFQLLWETIKMIEDSCRANLRELPALLAEMSPDVVVVDEVMSGVHSVCQTLAMPVVTLSCALTAIPDPAIPPVWSCRGPASSLLDRLRNRMEVLFQNAVLCRGLVAQVNAYRKGEGLAPISEPLNEGATILHLTQEPAEFSFPRVYNVDNLHHLGPLCDLRREGRVAFPWDKLDGRRLVYASMGTLQNCLLETFRTIARTCAALDVQLVISLGGGNVAPSDLGELRGAPLVVEYAPQLELLPKAAVFITHAGMNSAVEALSCGIPMVALPVGNDQPAVAARVEHCGAGISLQNAYPTEERLRTALVKVMNEPSFGNNAKRMAKSMNPEGAREKACGLIEDAVRRAAKPGEDRGSEDVHRKNTDGEHKAIH